MRRHRKLETWAGLNDDPAIRARAIPAARSWRHSHATSLGTRSGKRSTTMQVADILKDKGHSTMTVRPAETVQAFAMRLKLERVGAMPVSEDGKTLVGIISERDVAYGFAAHGNELAALRVEDLMSASVVTCSPTDSIAHVARSHDAAANSPPSGRRARPACRPDQHRRCPETSPQRD